MKFPRFPAYLKTYVETLSQRDPQAIAADLKAFDDFYFKPNGLMVARYGETSRASRSKADPDSQRTIISPFMIVK